MTDGTFPPDASFARSSRVGQAVLSHPLEWLMCVLASRGHPEFQARRDKLVVRIRVLCSHRSLGDICPPAHRSYAFLDINPLARGHALVIPKCPFFYIKRSRLGLILPVLNVLLGGC